MSNAQQSNIVSSERLSFRPRARILQMLGEQLIGNSRLAIFELVKNAYDADATNAVITLKGINTPQMNIEVEDNGVGMTFETIRDIWLVPAHDHKSKQKINNIRTKGGRLPLGEKGLGRFAVHKLGNKIELITKHENSQNEIVVKIDWSEQIEQEFLSDTSVEVSVRQPEYFKNGLTGTFLRITELKDTEWTRGEIRKLDRQIKSITSPFSNSPHDDFKTLFIIEGHDDWVDDISDIDGIKQRAPWYCKFSINEHGLFSLNYEFRKINGLDIQPRLISLENKPLLISNSVMGESRKTKSTRYLDEEILRGIGPITGEFYIYDRTPTLLQKFGESQLIKDYLDENGGIRVYRDGIRVYNYGELNDDWLGLDIRRVNIPGVRISRNIVLGLVELNLSQSHGLIEKTSREGFDDNKYYNNFRNIILAVITQIEAERVIDKSRLHDALLPAQDKAVRNVEKPIEAILNKLDTHPELKNEIEPLLNKIAKHQSEMQGIMLTQGLTNMGIGVIFHEVEHGIRDLAQFVKTSNNIEEIKSKIQDLSLVLNTFSELIKSTNSENLSIKSLFKTIRSIIKMRLKKHQIKLICPDPCCQFRTVKLGRF